MSALLWMSLLLGAANAALPEGYCDDDFAKGDGFSLRRTASLPEDNLLLTSARAGSMEHLQSDGLAQYVMQRLAASAFVAILFSLAFLATCPLCVSRLCCMKTCCRAGAKPDVAHRGLHAGAWVIMACVSVAFSSVGIHFAGGISNAVSLGACESVQLADDVNTLVDEVHEAFSSFNDVSDVLDETAHLVAGRSSLVDRSDSVLDGLVTFETTVRDINITGAELSTQDQILADVEGARASLSNGRPTLVEIDSILHQVSTALVDNSDGVRSVADSVMNLTLETPVSGEAAERFISLRVIPAQEDIHYRLVMGFVVPLVILMLSAIFIAIFVVDHAPVANVLPYGLNAAFCCQWCAVVQLLLLGSLGIALVGFVADICVVVADFPGNIREYQAAASDERAVGVIEGCFADPPRALVESLGILDSDVDLDKLIAFDQLEDIRLDGVLDVSAFHSARDQVNELEWHDFGLSVTRLELMESCCDQEAVCCSPEDCTDTDLGECSFAPPALQANRSVESTLSTLQSDMATLGTRVDEFDDAAAGTLSALRSVSNLTESIRATFNDIQGVGTCGFVAERYWGLEGAVCGVLLPSIYWVAVSQIVVGAFGIALSVLLLMMARLAYGMMPGHLISKVGGAGGDGPAPLL